MAGKSFVDKVYDSYIKSDYHYGDDNLNPKREIRKDTTINAQDELDKILAEIESKVTTIKTKYKNSSFRENAVSYNMNGDGKNQPGTPQALRNAIRRAGGSGDNLVLIPGFEDNYPNNLPLEIELIIPKIIGILPLAPTDGENGTMDPNSIPKTTGPSLFTIRCDGTIDLVTGKEKSEDDEGGNDGENRTDEFSDFQQIDNSNASSPAANKTSSKSNAQKIEESVREAREKMINNINRNKASAQDCALYDLEILKVILAILKVIRVLKRIISPALSIVVETVKLVVLAAQCWNNPTSVGEIINRMAEKIMGIVIMIVAILTQMLWNMLGLDCITTWSISKIQEIRDILAGISSIFEEIDRTALALNSGMEEIEDAWSKAEAAVSEALSYSLEDRLRDSIDIDSLTKDIYSSALVTDPKGVAKGMALESFAQTDAYEKVMKAANNIKSLEKTATNMVNAYNKLTKADGNVQKFSEKFSGIFVK